MSINYQLLVKITYQCTSLNQSITITPGWTKRPYSQVQNKRKKWKKYIYGKSPQNKELYDEAKEDSSKKVRQAQMRYEKDICQKAKDDPKVFWRFVQSKTKIKESIQCIIDDNGDTY